MRKTVFVKKNITLPSKVARWADNLVQPDLGGDFSKLLARLIIEEHERVQPTEDLKELFRDYKHAYQDVMAEHHRNFHEMRNRCEGLTRDNINQATEISGLREEIAKLRGQAG